VTTTTIGGGLRQLIVDSGLLGSRVFRDWAPKGVTYPMVVFTDTMSDAPVLYGDDIVMAKQRTAQVSLWQRLTKEDDGLPGKVERALDGQRLMTGNGAVYRVRVRDTQRIPQPDPDLVHHALTVAIWHDAASS
jgi:hypothetical protein